MARMADGSAFTTVYPLSGFRMDKTVSMPSQSRRLPEELADVSSDTGDFSLCPGESGEGRCPDITKTPPTRTRQRRIAIVIPAALREVFFSPAFS
jgi:hypothetical protein